MKKLPVIAATWCLAAMSSGPAAAQDKPTQLADLADLSLEQLTQVTVTSAARREQRIVDAPASIFVITAEDIRRSGVTSIPEALRLAPNLLVVRGDTSQYIVSARGNLSGTANKMLVLIDGRTVYTPLFSGVFYDALAVMLEDVERIEVISGPGSTLWGTNAVNGVINVITRSARQTRDRLVAAGGGNQERGGSVRAGWAAGEGGAMRLYARYFDRDEHRLESGAPARDGASRWQAGFRGDWDLSADSITLQGDVYRADVDNLGGARDMSGGNVLARWRRDLGAGTALSLQAYYDRTEREHAGSFREDRDTFDVEMQHSLRPAPGHRLAWGAAYRASSDKTIPTTTLGFLPPERTLSLGSLFAQDEIDLAANLRATLGLRAERNSYTGVEWLPNLRLSYAVSGDDVVWGALTRAVRSPSRIDRDLVVPGFPPFLVENNSTYRSELADVAEVGYRGNLGAHASVSITVFHHRFHELRTIEPLGSQLVFANGAQGRVTGIEAWGDLRPMRDWRLVWGFMAMRERSGLEPGAVNLGENPLGNNPKRTASLRSLWNATPTLQVDLFLRHVGGLANPVVPSYTELDARLGWLASRRLELSLAGANLLGRDHVEFGTPAQRAVFEPAWFLKATWMF